ncbi:MAG TPA: MmgE/PrpD family protein [Xanthomonadales bacterium]|nr:MmgE/PrpD family protein [Xanthomonadales bacterium]
MQYSTEHLSDTLCRHIAQSRFENIPAISLEATRRVVLDATGVILAASGLSPEITPFVKVARSAGDGPSTILGFGDSVSAPMAALANGAMAHALDFEDAFDPAPCHPNAATIPAAIAIAQAYGPIAGTDFLCAIAVGCDLVCRISLSLRQTMEESGWYPPPILGAFGATAAASRLLGLSTDQTRDALSLALCQATAPGEIKHSEGTVIRAVREAFPAQAAVLSALLARDGVKGFERPLEGRDGFFRLFVDGHYDCGDLLENLGSRYHVERLSFKPWPACRGTHAYIELALQLAKEHRFDWREIESVSVVSGSVQRMLLEPADRKQAPRTVIDAKFSIPFTLAVALVQGDVTLDAFNEETLHDPHILALAGRVHWEVRPEWGRDQAAAGALSLRLRDGRLLSASVEQALGHPDSPLSNALLLEKFMSCCRHAARPIDSAAAADMAQQILSLETSTDCGSIFRI